MDITTNETRPQAAAGRAREGLIVRAGRKVKEFFLGIAHGSLATKLSCLFMGSGQMMRRQYTKGALYLLIEVLFVLYMVFFGGRYLGFLFSGDLGTQLGTETWDEVTQSFVYTQGDNSFLILLYGVVSIIVLCLFITVWCMNVSGNIRNDKICNIAGIAPPQSYTDALGRIAPGVASASLSENLICVQGGRVKLTLAGDVGGVLEIGGERHAVEEIEAGVTRFGALLVTAVETTEEGTMYELYRDENVFSREYLQYPVYLYTKDGALAAAAFLRECGRVSTFREDCKQYVNKKFYVPLLVVPLIGLLVFTVMPLIFMILIAFTNYDYEHTPPGALFDWVGFANFAKIFSIGGGGSNFLLVFLRVLAWTFIWAIFATFTNYFFGMILALMINKKGIKLKMLWRTMFVIAIAVPQFVTLLLMQKILDAYGILNVILGLTGDNKILWLGDSSNWAIIPRVTIIVVNMWIGIPYTILMCSGILMNIPPEMYEAARLDGANPFQIFRNIVLPYMLHVTAPYLITQFVGNINNFNVIWLLSGGGPVDNINYGGGSKAQATDLLVTWLYRLTTDVNPQYNLASVIGIIIFVISAALSLITFNRSKANKNEEDYQ